MNSTESTMDEQFEFDRPRYLMFVLGLVYIFFSIVGVFFDAAIIKAIKKIRMRKTVVNRLVGFQAVVGMVCALTSYLPLSVVLLFDIPPDDVFFLCIVQDITSAYLLLVLYCSIAAVAIVRYLYVFSCDFMKRWERLAFQVIVIICFLAPIVAVFKRFLAPYSRHVRFCTAELHLLPADSFWKEFIPLQVGNLILLVLYVRIYIRLRTAENKRLASVTKILKSNGTNQTGLPGVKKRVNVVGAGASAFTIFLCEISVLSVQSLNLASLPWLAQWGLPVYFCMCLLAMSLSFTPALLYCLTNDEIRQNLLPQLRLNRVGPQLPPVTGTATPQQHLTASRS